MHKFSLINDLMRKIAAIAQEARLDIETLADEHDPHAQDIVPNSVEVD